MAKSTIAGLFGTSPFKPMQTHMDIVARCAAEVPLIVAAAERGDREMILELKEKIFALEEEADLAKHEIRSRLPKGLFMPVDRRDLLEILHAQDSIADMAQDVAGYLILEQAKVPDVFEDLLSVYSQRVVVTVEKCRDVVNELDELLVTGFRGRSVEKVEAMIEELGDLESETDVLGMDLMARLFDIEAGMTPGAFFIWHELIQKIGDIADYSEDVGDRLRLLIAR